MSISARIQSRAQSSSSLARHSPPPHFCAATRTLPSSTNGQSISFWQVVAASGSHDTLSTGGEPPVPLLPPLPSFPPSPSSSPQAATARAVTASKLKAKVDRVMAYSSKLHGAVPERRHSRSKLAPSDEQQEGGKLAEDRCGQVTQSGSRAIVDIPNAERRRPAEVCPKANLELFDGITGVRARAETPATGRVQQRVADHGVGAAVSAAVAHQRKLELAARSGDVDAERADALGRGQSEEDAADFTRALEVEGGFDVRSEERRVGHDAGGHVVVEGVERVD